MTGVVGERDSRIGELENNLASLDAMMRAKVELPFRAS